MRTISVADLREDLMAYLERARAGEEVVVTDEGRAVARLVPPEDVRVAARQALAALRSRARVGDVEAPLDEAWDAGDDRR